MNGPPTWYNAFLNTGQETNMHPRKNSQCMPVFVVDGVLLMAIMASSNVDHICYMSSSMQITLKTNWTRGKLLGSSTLLIPGSTLWKLWWNLRSLSCWGWSFFFSSISRSIQYDIFFDDPDVFCFFMWEVILRISHQGALWYFIDLWWWCRWSIFIWRGGF